MHIAIRHEFVHHAGERVARSEFKNFGNAGSPARLHARSPVHRLFDWRANFSAPVYTSNTVSPSIPLNSRTSDGTPAARCALASACRNWSLASASSGVCDGILTGNIVVSLRARDPCITDDGIQRLSRAAN
jgi:hypothetical protein